MSKSITAERALAGATPLRHPKLEARALAQVAAARGDVGAAIDAEGRARGAFAGNAKPGALVYSLMALDLAATGASSIADAIDHLEGVTR